MLFASLFVGLGSKRFGVVGHAVNGGEGVAVGGRLEDNKVRKVVSGFRILGQFAPVRPMFMSPIVPVSDPLVQVIGGYSAFV